MAKKKNKEKFEINLSHEELLEITEFVDNFIYEALDTSGVPLKNDAVHNVSIGYNEKNQLEVSVYVEKKECYCDIMTLKRKRTK